MFGIRAGGGRALEPGMLIRGVIQHHVQQHADAAFLGLCHQAIKVRQRSVLGIDILIVRNVVTEIDLR